MRALVARYARGLARAFWTPQPPAVAAKQLGHRPGEYRRWVAAHDTHSEAALDGYREAARGMARRPLVSVILAGAGAGEAVAETLRSLREQAYPAWELWLVPPAGGALPAPEDDVAVAEAPSCDAALAGARGEYILVVRAGDRLAPHALLAAVSALCERRDAAFAYADEDEIEAGGQRARPYFKSGWNPDLFLGQDFASAFALIPAELAREAGGFGVGAGAAYDFLLRLLDHAPDRPVAHVPAVLVHRGRAGGPPAHEAAEAERVAVADHLRRRSIAAQVTSLPGGGRRIAWPLPPEPPLVSLIVPTRDRVELLAACVEGLLRRTDYPAREIVIVDNESREPKTLAYFERLAKEPAVRVLPHSGPFNFSAVNNFAAERARGAIIGLINNDIVVERPDWLREMAAQAVRPEVGAVGALLTYDDGTVQHAGCVLGIGGVASHVFKHFDPDAEGHGGRLRVAQDLSAVTAACLLVRREVWEEVGGLDEDLPIAYNDIDFCLKLRRAGRRIVWTPFAHLKHLESASRGLDKAPERRARIDREKARMAERWGSLLLDDPFFNPNLSLTSTECRPAFPPRSAPTWRAWRAWRG